MNTELIPADQCRRVWKDVRLLLKPAVELSYGRWSLDYILASLVLGEQFLWITLDDDNEVCGVMTCQISFYPLKKMLTLHFMGGTNFDKWFHDAFAEIIKFASENGCDGIECNGRTGFWKQFKQEGFTKTAIFYERST